jgi:leucyl-tRNA synthetase
MNKSYKIKFNIKDSGEEITVETNRLDCIFGATFIAINPTHALTKGKGGDEFTGFYALNPLSKKEIPIWTADYFEGESKIGIPAHDEQDNEFAKKHSLEIVNVIEPITGEEKENEEFRRSIVALVHDTKANKVLSINWGANLGGNLFVGGGLNEGENVVECAKREIVEETGYKNVEFVESSEKIHHHYFAASKNVYRNIEATGVYFKLTDDSKVETALEEDEKNKFTVEWLSIEETRAKIKDPLHKFVFNKFIESRINTEKGILCNSAEFNGLTSDEAISQILKRMN